MATPIINKEYEEIKMRAKELIAAGGCAAIKFWSNTDADRLCPKEHRGEVKFEPLEGMVYADEWLESAQKAVELINRGIALLTPVPSSAIPQREEEKDWTDDPVIIAMVTAVMREADPLFEKTGGGTRHYVREFLLPIMARDGLTIINKFATPPIPQSENDGSEAYKKWLDKPGYGKPEHEMIQTIRRTTASLISKGPEACEKFLRDAGILEPEAKITIDYHQVEQLCEKCGEKYFGRCKCESEPVLTYTTGSFFVPEKNEPEVGDNQEGECPECAYVRHGAAEMQKYLTDQNKALEAELAEIHRTYEKEPYQFLLVNALRLLSNEQMKMLADALYDRIPKSEVGENQELVPENTDGWYERLKRELLSARSQRDALQAELSSLKDQLANKQVRLDSRHRLIVRLMKEIDNQKGQWFQASLRVSELLAEIDLLRKGGASLRTRDQQKAAGKAHAIAAMEYTLRTTLTLVQWPLYAHKLYEGFMEEEAIKNQTHQP